MHTSLNSDEKSTTGCVLQKPSHDQIAAMAYHLFVEQGAYDGHDLDDWLRAEQLLTLHLNESIVLEVPEAEFAAPHTNDHQTYGGAHYDLPLADLEIEIPHRSALCRPAPTRGPSRQAPRLRRTAKQYPAELADPSGHSSNSSREVLDAASESFEFDGDTASKS